MSETASKTVINALIGAIATIVLSFTVISPILGGALAGYLEKEEGVRVGAISGIIAAVPLFGLAVVIAGLGVIVTGIPLLGVFVLIFAFSFGLVYIIGLSALGGYLGVYLANEFDNNQ